MSPQDKAPEGVRDGGPAPKSEPLYTVYECVYPDARRRQSGEPADEAVSRAFFEFLPDAEHFRLYNGGVINPVPVTRSQRQLLFRQRKLGNRVYRKKSR